LVLGTTTTKSKWILGDPDKAWHNYPSLRAFALDFPEGTEPPIGQHAVSFTSAGNLMFFNNGYASFAHSPSGDSRSTSFPPAVLIEPEEADGKGSVAVRPLAGVVEPNVFEHLPSTVRAIWWTTRVKAAESAWSGWTNTRT